MIIGLKKSLEMINMTSDFFINLCYSKQFYLEYQC